MRKQPKVKPQVEEEKPKPIGGGNSGGSVKPPKTDPTPTFPNQE